MGVDIRPKSHCTYQLSIDMAFRPSTRVLRALIANDGSHIGQGNRASNRTNVSMLSNHESAPHPRSEKKQVKYKAQRIQLTGFGCSAFDDLIASINYIQDHIERSLPEGSLTRWSPSYDSEGYPAVDISNRYLTGVRDRGDLEILPITDSLDPFRHLRSAMGTFWTHTQDNEVVCFRRDPVEIVEGQQKYR
jgi:hypothetical protein